MALVTTTMRTLAPIGTVQAKTTLRTRHTHTLSRGLAALVAYLVKGSTAFVTR